MNSTSTSANSTSSAPPVLPRDARLIALLLAANGAEDCEEGVVRMLVEFAHRYTSDILTDSLLYAEHARAATSGNASNQQPLTPSIDDIRLAVQARTESAQVPKEFLLQLATQVNSVPLPPVPEVYGIRLPPVAQRLTAPNFSIVPRSNPLPGNELENTNETLNSGGAGGDGTQTAEGSEAGGGLFGDDDDDDDDSDEDDEEMEDVTAGLGGTGEMSGGAGGSAGMMSATNGTKRKAGESDEEYD
ncbi:hypothetical protein JCM3765_005713 [Sporobolomyces pararoseus]